MEDELNLENADLYLEVLRHVEAGGEVLAEEDQWECCRSSS